MGRSHIPLLRSAIFARVVYCTACLLAALLVLLLSFRLGRDTPSGISFSWNGRSFVMFNDMVYGSAKKPFVARCLAPMAIGLLSQAVYNIAGDDGRAALKSAIFVYEEHGAENVREVLARRPQDPATWDWVMIRHGMEPGGFVEYFFAFLILLFSLFGFPYALRSLMRATIDAPPAFASLVSIAALLGVPRLLQYYNYLYDFPGLFLFTLTLAAMARREWRAYFFIFPFATLNKETTILLIGLFALYFSDSRLSLPRRAYWGMIGAQAAIWLATKAALAWMFAGNNGPMVEIMFFSHNYEVLRGLLGYFSPLEFIGVLAVAFLLFFAWNEKPGFLRTGMWMAAAHVFILVITGWLEESRIYFEIYGIGVLLAAFTFGKLIGLNVSARPTDDPGPAQARPA